MANTTPEPGLPNLSIAKPPSAPDFVTFFGLVFTFGLIGGAIAMGQSNANFFNVQSVAIVLLGTITATATSYSLKELKDTPGVLAKCLYKENRNYKLFAKALLDLAAVSRKKGLLYLSNFENQTKKEPFLNQAIGMAVDGYSIEDISQVLQQDIDTTQERGMRTAGIMKRASEVAPAMGLIGTLVGLVQMLADLENPEVIGPAMAVALLTTFYGAILGTVIMSPLGAKIEKNVNDELLMKTLVLKSLQSMTKQENPRALEMLLNSLLPPTERIKYFD